MKTKRTLLIAGSITIIALGSFAAGVWAQGAQQGLPLTWHWPDSMDSVNAAPKNHRVLFENDHVRLLEVVVQPGETENMHGHKFPSVFMMDAPQPKIVNKDLEEATGDANRPRPPRPPQDGEAQYPTCRAMTSPQAPHQVTNTESFPQHFYRMEFKKIDGEAIRKMTKYPPN
jgi:hypothetical protein